ncbi:MAG: hypothetical protein ACYTKD_30700 [Planctomycetota bacterium]|jgi:hypothetical protein
MPVTIVPVRCAEGKRTPVDFALPEVDRACETAQRAIEGHPFLAGEGYEFSRDVSSVKVAIEVAVEDGSASREYSGARLGAEIRYDPFIEGPEREVELFLHLRCYMGEPVEPRPEGPMPPAEELAGGAFDPAGLARTLWHEYGHLLDAVRPAFRYDIEVKRRLSVYERAVVNELWNAYIDRRLAKLAPEPDRRHITPLPTHTRPSLEMMLRGIWADGREWTYREIVQAALDIPPR